MSSDKLQAVRQYSFSSGPNYTDSPLSLAETECAEADNVFSDGIVRTVPGAARIVSTAMANTVVGLYQYNQSSGAAYFLAASAGGRLAYQDGDSWINISTGLSSAVNTYYNWVVFNDTLVVLNGNDAPKKWNGVTFGDLSGTPPRGRFGVVHTDYVLIAGQTSAPSQIQYSDTAALQTWPVGNVINPGIDDGQVITGLIHFGDSTVIFKDRSIYLLAGKTASEFTLQPTLSDVGCVAPNSIVLTDLGVWFWSEAGPALFNGFKTILLNRRLRRLLDDVNWDATLSISATYYPYRKQVLVSYPTVGSPFPDRALIFDLYHLGDDRSPTVFWPLTKGWSAAAAAMDSTGRKRAYFGHPDGYVTTYDSGTTWNGTTIVPRLRTRGYAADGRLDLESGLRAIDIWTGGTTTRMTMKTAVDGSTFTAHGQSPFTITGASAATASAATLKYIRADGDGAGSNQVGRLHQVELSIAGATPIAIHGIEVGLEPRGRREPRRD